MSQKIDELIGSFRQDVAPPTLPTPSEVARTAAVSGRGAHRRHRLALAGATLATGAAVAVFAILLTLGGSTRSTPAAVPARVDWGLTVTLQVVPDIGETVDAAVARTVTWIQQRAANGDLAGVEVEQLGGDRLQITAPGAHDETDLVPITVTSRLAVHDLGRALAESDTIEGLQASADATGRPIGFFIVGDRTVALSTPTRADAEKYRQGAWTVAGLPDGLRVLTSNSGNTLEKPTLVDDALALVPSYAMRAVTVDASSVIVDVAPEARDAVSKAIGAYAGTSPRIVLAAEDWLLGPPPGSAAGAPSGSSTVIAELQADRSAPDGSRLVFDASGSAVASVPADPATGAVRETPNTAAALGSLYPETAVRARLRVIATEPYGQPPPVDGDHVTLPKSIEQSLDGSPDGFDGQGGTLRIPSSSVSRILSVDGSPRFDLFTARTDAGHDLMWTAGASYVLGGRCDVGMGTPTVRMCGVDQPAGEDFLTFGRSAPGVASVQRIDRDGTATAGVVRNSWWAIRAPTRWDGSYVVARDAEGHELRRFALDWSVWKPVPTP